MKLLKVTVSVIFLQLWRPISQKGKIFKISSLDCSKASWLNMKSCKFQVFIMYRFCFITVWKSNFEFEENLNFHRGAIWVPYRPKYEKSKFFTLGIFFQGIELPLLKVWKKSMTSTILVCPTLTGNGSLSSCVFYLYISLVKNII